MYICICKAVTDSQILTAIDNGMCTRKKLTHCFGLGKDCGKCNQDVIALLQQTSRSAQSFSCPSNQVDVTTENSLCENFVPNQCQKPFDTINAIRH